MYRLFSIDAYIIYHYVVCCDTVCVKMQYIDYACIACSVVWCVIIVFVFIGQQDDEVKVEEHAGEEEEEIDEEEEKEEEEEPTTTSKGACKSGAAAQVNHCA